MAVPPQTAGGFAFAFTSPPWVPRTPLVLSTSQVMLNPPGWGEQGGSPRVGRGGLGQGPAEGSWPRAGGRAGCASLWDQHAASLPLLWGQRQRWLRWGSLQSQQKSCDGLSGGARAQFGARVASTELPPQSRWLPVSPKAMLEEEAAPPLSCGCSAPAPVSCREPNSCLL